MGLWRDLLGTTKSFFKIGITGVRLKDSSGNLLVRNNADSADANVTAAKVSVSGELLEINSDAVASGADWKMTLARPTSGMTAAVTWTFPTTAGSPGQALTTDGSGNLSTTSITTAQNINVDTTTLNFGSSSPVTMFTLPANAIVHFVECVIDSSFNGTPAMTVGVSGSTTKYMGTLDNDLTAAAGTVFLTSPGQQPDGSSEALVITYSAGSASAGSARVMIHYSIPT